MAKEGGEKTEKPTPKKRKESRKQGQVARSQDIGGWASVLAVGMALPTLVGREVEALVELMTTTLRAAERPEPAIALQLLGEGLWHCAAVVVLLGAAVMLIGVAGALGQGGFYLATKAVKPTWSKLDPIKGFKRIFGPQAAWEGVKVLVKSAVVGFFVWGGIQAMMPVVGGFVTPSVVLDQVAEVALTLVRNVAIAGVVMGVLDYLVHRRRIGKETRMSKEEVKQEHKQTEGDPLVKSAIRSRQLAAARNRMMADVPSADVVLVNPTHVAVALRYEASTGAPRVVAKGAGAIAARIRAGAAEADVPLVQDVPLARALYRSCTVGQEIPAELFAAVAQVLAFVISRRTHGVRGGEHRSPRRERDLPVVPLAGRRRRTVRTSPAVAPGAAGA